MGFDFTANGSDSAGGDIGRYSQGNGSLKATVENIPNGYGYPGVELLIADGEPLNDWSAYESFIVKTLRPLC